MKIYAILDKTLTKESTIGYLFCYEKAGEYIIELNENLDEWEAPLLFQKYVREGIFTIPKNNALPVQGWTCPKNLIKKTGRRL